MAEKGTGSSYSSMSTFESSSCTMVFYSPAFSMSELISFREGGPFIRQGAFVSEGRLERTCQLRGALIR